LDYISACTNAFTYLGSEKETCSFIVPWCASYICQILPDVSDSLTEQQELLDHFVVPVIPLSDGIVLHVQPPPLDFAMLNVLFILTIRDATISQNQQSETRMGQLVQIVLEIKNENDTYCYYVSRGLTPCRPGLENEPTPDCDLDTVKRAKKACDFVRCSFPPSIIAGPCIPVSEEQEILSEIKKGALF
jgi:hypothetical protein